MTRFISRIEDMRFLCHGETIIYLCPPTMSWLQRDLEVYIGDLVKTPQFSENMIK